MGRTETIMTDSTAAPAAPMPLREVIAEYIGDFTMASNQYSQNITLLVDDHPKLAAFIADNLVHYLATQLPERVDQAIRDFRNAAQDCERCGRGADADDIEDAAETQLRALCGLAGRGPDLIGREKWEFYLKQYRISCWNHDEKDMRRERMQINAMVEPFLKPRETAALNPEVQG